MDETGTNVFYYLTENQSVPFLITLPVPPDKATLNVLKSFLRKVKDLKDVPYSYYVKINDPSVGMEYKKEIISDDSLLPLIDGKVLLWLREIDSKNSGLVSNSSSVFDMNSSDLLNATLFPKSHYYLVNKPNDPDENELRRRAYCIWANREDLKRIFINTIKDARKHMELYYLDLGRMEVDILLNLLKKPHQKPKSLDPVPVAVNIHIIDYPLESVIPVPKLTLSKTTRDIPTSALKRVGLQHVVISNTATDSESSATESSDNETPHTSKKNAKGESDLKICQIARRLDYDKELYSHEYNSTRIDPTTNGAWVDILIYIERRTECTKLETYLGIICLEDAVAAEVKAVTLTEMLETRFQKMNAKSYRLLQNVIARKLMFGRSNICVTSNQFLYTNVKARLKALIINSRDKESTRVCEMMPYTNIQVELEVDSIAPSFTSATTPSATTLIPPSATTPTSPPATTPALPTSTSSASIHILKYVSAINAIVDVWIGVKSNIPVIYYCKNEKKYYEISFPLYSIIPLYILKFFADTLIRNPQNCNLSFDMLE